MARLNLTISEETSQTLQAYLQQTGRKKEDLTKFVEDAVRSKILRETIRDTQEQNEVK